MTVAPFSDASDVLYDPLDKLVTVALIRDSTLDNLIEALSVTSEEAELVHLVRIGKQNNPLWMYARQW